MFQLYFPIPNNISISRSRSKISARLSWHFSILYMFFYLNAVQIYQNQLPKCPIRNLKSKIQSKCQKLSDFKVQKQNFCKTQLTLNNNIYVYLTKCCPKIPKLASKVPNQNPQKQKPKQLQPSNQTSSFSSQISNFFQQT